MTRPAVDLLGEPHHDTGPALLLGDRVPGAELTARLWVPTGRAPQRVLLRQVVDGEPAMTPMDAQERRENGTWWTGPVRLVNPVNRYRFLLLDDAEGGPYTWYHAAGVADHDVPDATDFQVLSEDSGPDWVLDAVAYEIFPDRFAAHEPIGARTPPPWAEPRAWLDEPPAAGPSTGRAWYGGDLDGIADHLDYIQGLGADTVYLTPVFPAGSTHRYDASTFDRVDPLLGGDEALERLSAALHARGMRLVLDLTTNHTGATHEWFTRAAAHADSPEAGFYSFTRHPDQYAAWLDVPSLPKLDHRSPRLRERLVSGPRSVTAHWISEPVNADGWRTDVANMTGRLGRVDLAHQVAADMRETMRQVEARTGRPLWLVAEHGHDASRDLEGPGWHGTMNYLGFTRPLWAWLSGTAPATQRLWDTWPTPVPRLPGDAVIEGVRQYAAQMPSVSMSRSMNLLGSHDTPRVRSVVATREAQLVAATALFTAPGVPTIFSGDELGATGTTGEHSRTTMPWAEAPGVPRSAAAPAAPTGTTPPGTEPPAPSDDLAEAGSWGPVDRHVLERYRHLAARRRELPGLRRGGLRWVLAERDLIAWERTHPDGDVLVVLARAAGCAELPLDALPADGVRSIESFDAVDCVVETRAGRAGLRVSADGPGSAIIVLGSR